MAHMQFTVIMVAEFPLPAYVQTAYFQKVCFTFTLHEIRLTEVFGKWNTISGSTGCSCSNKEHGTETNVSLNFDNIQDSHTEGRYFPLDGLVANIELFKAYSLTLFYNTIILKNGIPDSKKFGTLCITNVIICKWTVFTDNCFINCSRWHLSVSQGSKPYLVFACETLNLSGLAFSYPVIILSPVPN